MLLIIDNYDSFTYNVSRYFEELGQTVKVVLHDQISIAEIEALQPQYIVISPGPCTPNESGISLEVINQFADKLPLLGICLGHQCIIQHFGGQIIKAKQAIHGKTSKLHHDQHSLFTELETGFNVTRYHSLVADKPSLPECLEVTAWTQTDDGTVDEIMAIQHKTLPIYGVQFHPEAVLTQNGHAILNNFLTRSLL
ncbi:anthranilate synthase component II [Marinicellulosiphila megalodicopiae]|uniref:anthranilate synthase component II n=1 Tax=Marinicellulosiphila megalodicopiae TaxID=2724896 RepID=UPI003BB1FB66